LILAIARTALISLRRDRASLSLSFILPVAFFTIFAVIFGSHRDTTPKVSVILVDEDHSGASQSLINGLRAESALDVSTRPEAEKHVQPADYTAATAEAAVRAGKAPLALIIPQGFGDNPISFGPPPPGHPSSSIQMLQDSSDMVAPQMVLGLLQKVVMTSMPDAMAEQGSKYMEKYAGGFTPEQRQKIEDGLAQLRRRENERRSQPSVTDNAGESNNFGLISVTTRDVVGENKKNPMVSFYAAAIGVMFLLFTASGASGALLDEAESGALDRVLSTRVTMGTLLGGKMFFCALLAFAQLVVMFVWAWLVFKIDFLSHIPGFVIMGLSTAFAVAAFGMLLASICRTRAQLGAVSTLVILIMSSVGGSMFPRFLMPPAMQKAGLLTINAWAIDGFTKVFWRDEPISHLWPQVTVLLAIGVVLFAIARKLAQRWEYA
jgi:ABC-2 type transport system permease protein